MLDDATQAELAAVVESLPFRQLGSEPLLASDEEIQDIEELVGATLPLDYRCYIQTVGKMFVSTDYVVQPAGEDDLYISLIYGGTDPSEVPDSHSLAWNYQTFSEHKLKPGELVIGQDLFGDMYALNVTTDRLRYFELAGDASIDLGVSGFLNFLRLIVPGPDLDDA